MTLLLGCLVGIGALLVASPFLWPRAPRVTAREPRGLRVALDRAGLARVPPAAFLVVALIVAVACAALAQALVPVPVLVLGAGAVGFVAPFAALRRRGLAARRSQRTVWPDVVDDLVSSIRAGRALPESLSRLAVTGPAAVRPVFDEFARDYRRTGRFGECLDRAKGRLADPVADRLIETARMAREVGGSDLTVVLRGLAADLREEAAIRHEVEARQSWVVNAARLGVAAPWIVLGLLATRPEARQAYSSGLGTLVIAVGVIASVLAYRLMVAIGRIPDERRWFG